MRNQWDDMYGEESIGFRTYPSYAPVTRSTGGWKQKYGGKGWSKKSWSKYSFIIDFDDNDDDLFVKAPANYITPTGKEIKNKVSVREDSSINMIKELARVCYFKMIDEKDYVADDFKDESQYGSEQNIKKELYDSIYDQFLPGFTPLEQAISVFLKLRTKVKEDGTQSKEEVDMEQGFDFERDLYFDATINDQLELNELSKERKMEIFNTLSLVGQFGHEFKVEKEISEKIVANSDQYSKMIMRSHDQLTMIDTYQRLLPNFDLKFLTKDLTVNVPVDRKEQIQKIIIILDYSGSMDDNEKQIWVNAILIDRFRYVIKGEAEVFFSYFIDNPDQLNFQHIKNKEDVIAFWQTFSNDPNGGMTEVGEMVDRIASSIAERKLCNLDVDLSEEKPEILIINDGQDSIHTDKFPYKVNAITLFEHNRQLKTVCLDTHGKLIHVSDDEVFAYSVDGGKQKIGK